ncbi:MAG: MurR/RpiR family transcriptional regulator [Lachnospiraceae bacterium]|nr:MurR/RpiR family transcriptional regulator [Lachnospiraceae bacterium]
MEPKQDIVRAISDQRDRLSKGHRKIADYILEHGEDASFMTAMELGQKLGISESTVVRFASKIGYKGYSQMQEALQSYTKSRFRTVAAPELSEKTFDTWGVIASVFQSDMEKISNAMENLSESRFAYTVDLLLSAKHVYIVGLRNSAPLASFLYFYLNMIRPDVVLLNTTAVTELFEQMLHIGNEDALVAISFPRYSIRTLKAMEMAKDHGASIVALTDSEHSPMTMYSTVELYARSNLNSVADSLVAPMCVLNALIVAMCLKEPERVTEELKALEEAWDSYQVYSHDEINRIDIEAGFGVKKEKPDE